MSADRSVDILLVEDNPGDVLLCTEMLKEAKVRSRVHVVNDGAEAMAYLRREGRHARAKTPDMIILDLKLPKLSGHDVLRLIKCDPELMVIPVIIMSSSDAEEDILRAYRLHANCYITKPVGLDQFTRIVRSIDDFWLTVVELPGRMAH